MRTWLRLMAVWIIAVALPVQGIAGVTLAHCGPGHERMAAAFEDARHAHAGHDAATPHHHAAAVDHDLDQTDQGASAPTKAKPGALTELGKYKCSSCAACCAGTALPSAVPRVPQASAGATVFAEEMVAVDAFASDGPERPPRVPLL